MSPLFYLVLFFLLSNLHVYAQDTYKVQIPVKTYLPSEEITLEFSAVSCSQSIKVMPKADVSSLEIFDVALNTWKPVNTNWSQMPYLRDSLKIRFQEVNNKKVNISLLFQDAYQGKIYTSDTIPIWISDVYTNYIPALNDNINSY